MNKIIGLLLAILLTTYCQAQKEKLQLNLSNGDTYSLNMVTNTSSVIEKSGKPVETEGTTYMRVNYKVIDFHDALYNMEVSIDSISFKGNLLEIIPENLRRYLPKNFIPVLISLIKAKPYAVIMTKQGKIMEVKRIEQDTSKLHPVVDLVVKNFLESIPAIYTDSMVSIGDKWLIKNKSSNSLFPNFETTYELKEVSEQYLILVGISSMKLAAIPPGLQNSNDPVKPNITNTISSQFKINKKTGWIVSGKIIQNIKGTVQGKENPKDDVEKILSVSVINETIFSEN